MGAVGNRIAHRYPGAVATYADLLARTRAAIREVTPAEVALGAVHLLDVREPDELAEGALPGAIAIPMGRVPAEADALDASRPVVCVCHHGMRSLQVAVYLERNGFAQVGNLAGGIDAWSRDADPSCPTY